MDKNYIDKNSGIIVLVGFSIMLAAVGMVAYNIGRAHKGTNAGVGQELGAAAGTYRELTTEQRTNLELVERIRSITEETNIAYGKLGELNRGSSNISAQIRAEAELLENYYRSIRGILGDNADNLGR